MNCVHGVVHAKLVNNVKYQNNEQVPLSIERKGKSTRHSEFGSKAS